MVPHFEDLAQNEQVFGVFFLQDARMPTFSGVSKVIKIVPNVLLYCGLRNCRDRTNRILANIAD